MLFTFQDHTTISNLCVLSNFSCNKDAVYERSGVTCVPYEGYQKLHSWDQMCHQTFRSQMITIPSSRLEEELKRNQYSPRYYTARHYELSLL